MINIADPFIKLVAYADDLTLDSHGADNHNKTQRTINQCIKRWRLSISAEKCELIRIIGPGRRPSEPDLPKLQIDGQTIRPEDHLKILGLLLDWKQQSNYG